MSIEKRWTVNHDSNIYLTIEHRRENKKPKYSFSVVAKNIMISATLIASLAVSMANASPAYASTVSAVPTKTISTMSITQSSNTINRLAGNSRYDTAAQIAREGWQQGSDYVILAFGENYPDALSSAPLASKYNAPILLTEKDTLTTQTRQVLSELKVKHVFIVGGTGVVSDSVANQLKSMSISVNRISGDSRYDTSVEIAKQLSTNIDTAFIVTGDGYADALSVGSIAGKLGLPILLIQKDAIPDSVQSYLSSHNITKTYVIGGTGVISDSALSQLPNPERIYGSSRYDTNIAVLNKFASTFNSDSIAVATGEGFADALAGASYSAKNANPVVLIPGTPNHSTQQYISSKVNNLSKVVVFGGEAVVPNASVTNYLKGTALTQTSTEDKLVSNIKTAANFVKTLYNSNTVTAMSLNQLAQRLVEIEVSLNTSGFKYGQNLVTAIQDTDTKLSGIDLSKQDLVISGDATTVYNKTKSVLNSVKGKVGLQITNSTSSSSQDSDSPTNSKVIYAAPITEYGQALSLTPMQGYEKLQVKYGYHTYGSNNQKEYDAVLKAVEETKLKVDQETASGENKVWNAVHNYITGTPSDKDKKFVEEYWKDLINLPIVNQEQLIRAYSASGSIFSYSSAPASLKGESAYLSIYFNQGDCNASSYATQAVYDSFGYNTRIRHSSSHAWCEVEIDGKWYVTDSGLSYDPGYHGGGLGTLIPETFSGKY